MPLCPSSKYRDPRPNYSAVRVQYVAREKYYGKLGHVEPTAAAIAPFTRPRTASGVRPWTTAGFTGLPSTPHPRISCGQTIQPEPSVPKYFQMSCNGYGG